MRRRARQFWREFNGRVSKMMRPVERAVGTPLEWLAGGWIRTGSYGHRLWAVLVFLFVVGALLRWASGLQLIGLLTMAGAAVLLGQVVVLKHGLWAWEAWSPGGRPSGARATISRLASSRRSPVRAVGRAAAVMILPAVPTALAVSRLPRPSTNDVIVSLLVALPTVVVLMTLVRAVFRRIFGPFHDESSTEAYDDPLLKWMWSGPATAPERSDSNAGLEAIVVARLKRRAARVGAEPELVVEIRRGHGPWRERAPILGDNQGDNIYRFELDHLPPDTRCRYWVRINDEASDKGSLLTPPTDIGKIVIAAGSCASTGSRGKVFDAIKAVRPHLFVHLGDLHYENISSANVKRRLDAFDAVLTSPAQAALYRSAATAYIWDDHDYGRNNADGTSASKDAALSTYRQVVPHRLPPNRPAIYQAFSLGPVRVIMTDTRSERNLELDSATGEPKLLSNVQQQWLLREIELACADHRVILWCCSTPWNNDSEDDTWFGFRRQRADISQSIEEIRPISSGQVAMIYLNGDAHNFALDDGTNSSYGTSGIGIGRTERGFHVVNAAALDRRASSKGGRFSDGVYPGAGQFAVLEFTSTADTTEVKITGHRWDGSEIAHTTVVVPDHQRAVSGPTSGETEDERMARPGEDLSGSEGFRRIWLYFSGGGIRSGLGALGTVFFLTQPEAGGDEWSKVQRIVSVSGGSIENAALTQVDDDEAIPEHLRQTFHRMTHHGHAGRYVLSLLSLIILTAVAVGIFSGVGSSVTNSRAVPWVLFGVGASAAVWAVIQTARSRDVSRSRMRYLGLFAGLTALLIGISYIYAEIIDRLPSFVGVLLKGLIFIVICVGFFQTTASIYTRQRIRWMIGSKRRSSSRQGGPRTGRIHLFSAADVRSGVPAYVAMSHARTLLIDDQTSITNRIDTYDGGRIGPDAATYASSAWPLLLIPYWRRFTLLRATLVGAPALDMADRNPRTVADGQLRPFALMDGGLTGTLAGRLDPYLDRVNSQGIMGAIDGPNDPGGDSSDVRRIVVDGGQHMGVTRTWWLAMVPGLSALKTGQRAIKVSLNGQITVDRAQAGAQSGVWHIQVTGHGRVFKLRVRRGRGQWADAVPVVATREGVLDRRLEVGTSKFARRGLRLSDSQSVMADGTKPENQKVVELLDDLRWRADRVGLFFGYRKHGVACAASAVAGGYIQAQGVGDNLDELCDLLARFEGAVLKRGGLDAVLAPTGPLRIFRWDELAQLLDQQGPGRPFAMSHRGDTVNGTLDDNSQPAFKAAYNKGFRVLECDVQVTSDEHLVAVHGLLGRVKGRHWWSWRRVSAMSKDDLDAFLEPKKAPKITDLVAALGTEVTWNFEAKHRRAMTSLLDELDSDCRLKGRQVIVSGGWRTKLLRSARVRAARRRQPDLMTAAGLNEVIRLTLGRPALHVAVVQLNGRLHWLFRRAAHQARKQRIQVHWYNVNKTKTMLKLAAKDGYERDGINTDRHEELIDVLNRLPA